MTATTPHFHPEDVIVWAGCITKYGVIQHWIGDDDDIRKANTEELIRYNNRPEK